MKILDRYIALTLIKVTLLALFSLILLFSFFALIDQLDATGRGNYGIWQALTYVLLTVPRLAFELFPIAAVIGSMTTLGMFSKSSELAVLRTSGVSQLRFAWALSKGTAVLVLLSLFVGEIVSPYTEETAQQMRSVALSGQITLKSKYGFWSRDGHSFINIRKILPGDKVEGIYIYEFDDEDKLRTSTFARRAEYKDEQWVLEDIRQTEITDEGVNVNRMAHATWDALLSPDVINLIIIKPQFLSFIGLYDYIKYLKINGQSSVIYEQAIWSKIINPLTILVMVLIAIPLVKTYSRMTGVGQRVFFGCLIGIVFHISSQIAGHMGVVYNFNPALSVTFPSVFMLSIIIWLLRKMV
ncbi:MAG: LPS export ABC transporter permease LptG [Gammaproteobacteria bacterium]|nr:MAG: LPS export ABC transporter permease LptG [Gammaproteobacteria bacterium]RKZ71780.1 MAG: LPS export ABC transporter permease LptG [Gammaproteobacteria bacterium]